MQEDLSVLTRANRAHDQSLRYGDHANQLGDVWFGGSGAAQRPLLMVVHGGFWRPQYDRSESVSMSVALADLGWTVVSIEYRREPGRAELTIADIAQALDRLPQQMDGHSGDVIMVGNSAGGHLCLWAAHNIGASRLRAVVALAPIADLRLARSLGLGKDAVADFLGANADDQPALDPARCDPVEKKICVIHGAADSVVPPEISQSYCTSHPSARLVQIENAGHFALIDPLSEAWSTVVAEIGRMTDSVANLPIRLSEKP